MNFLCDYLRAEDLFIDVGANIGVYSLLAARLPGVHVVSFEPSQDAWHRLLENIELNGLSNVTALRAAVTQRTGPVRITRGQDTINHLVHHTASNERTEIVSARTIDEVLKSLTSPGPVALIKIDVEGSEVDVLASGSGALTRDTPALIVENNFPAEIDAMLTPFGYSFYTYKPESRRLEAIDMGSTRLPNVIAIADIARANERLERSRTSAS
jgi:FkbM family methyltransferase